MTILQLLRPWIVTGLLLGAINRGAIGCPISSLSIGPDSHLCPDRAKYSSRHHQPGDRQRNGKERGLEGRRRKPPRSRNDHCGQ